MKEIVILGSSPYTKQELANAYKVKPENIHIARSVDLLPDDVRSKLLGSGYVWILTKPLSKDTKHVKTSFY